MFILPVKKSRYIEEYADALFNLFLGPSAKSLRMWTLESILVVRPELIT